ncbi:MAG: bifunctional phosphopantothenoylcysteine decarboxylase/phosphopantothenate--cysteine ligase CoaBC [Actinomycetia bacterium]|nr:bifunctional phosphopantothenoylcysteine decarboxylase/phosphopantothenate--cysteine ligase CoaBC [Actinomycetes bacterium]
MFAGRRIVLGVTGGVAAYKAAYLARRFIELDAEVRTVMTPAAEQFIGAATFAALTGTNPVTDLFGGTDVSPHTTLAAWADLIVVAPTTAATLSKLAHGESSNALTATVLATRAPVVVAPAMHTEMWEHPATRENVAIIERFGYTVIPPESGALAGGDHGVGRLADPEMIVAVVDGILGTGDLEGEVVLVTAGGTRESIDPVRYIGNRSSGKMGNAVARSAVDRGARVILVSAGTAPSDLGGIQFVPVESAADMAEAAWTHAPQCTIAVMTAAVADFRPKEPRSDKLRRAEGLPDIDLEPTPDVLKGVHESDPRPYLVGFAAEVGSLDTAVDKAKRKGVDLLVANDVAIEGSGFGSDNNQVAMVTPLGDVEHLPLMPKADVATAIWDRVVEARRSTPRT